MFPGEKGSKIVNKDWAAVISFHFVPFFVVDAVLISNS